MVVRPASLNLPASILVTPGLIRTVTLNLSDPAPEGGLLVALTSSDTSKVTAPESITVPEGQKTANFNLAGIAQGNAIVSASATDYLPASIAATIQEIAIGIGNPAVSSINVLPDVTKSFAVTLSKPAPTNGVTINLDIANSSIAAVTPASVTIPEGQTSSGNLSVTVKGLISGSTTLTADATGFAAANIPVNVTNKPDLTVTAVTLPSAPIGPNSNGSYHIPVSFTVANGGASAAQPAWYDRVYLSSDAVLDGSDQNLWAPYRGSVVAADGSYTPSATLTTSTGTAVGTYYVIVVADSDGYLAETDNNNNARVSASQVTLSPRPRPDGDGGDVAVRPNRPEQQRFLPHPGVVHGRQRRGQRRAAGLVRPGLPVQRRGLGRQRPEPMGTVPWQRGRRRRVVYAQRHPDHLDRHRGRHLLCHCGRRLRRLPCRDRQQQQRAGVGEPGDAVRPGPT